MYLTKWIHARPNRVDECVAENRKRKLFFGMFERKIIPSRTKNPKTYMSLVLEIGQFEVHFASNCQKSLVFLSYPWYFRVPLVFYSTFCTTKYHGYDKKTKDF